MRRADVEVCVCSECMLNGSMDIIESIESLSKLKSQLKLNSQINVETSKCIGEAKHGEKSPVVSINGNIFEHATSENIMSYIISLSSKDVKY